MSRARIAFTALGMSILAAFGCRSSGSSGTSAAAAEPAPVATGAAATTDVVGVYPKPPLDELKKKLTPLQFEVTQNEATEPPFHNDYWNNHEPGIYVDVVTGEPLFSSTDKFESGTGWPSFSRPIAPAHVASKSDSTLGMDRTEVRSASGDSHLGHVFDDGPAPTGLRYCINSASLRFVPASELEAQGYGAFRSLFAAGRAAAATATSSSATVNSCTKPRPGEHAGCSTTLETAILGGDAYSAAALTKLAGVLQVDRGAAKDASAIRVVFDPKTLTFGHLLDAWATAAGADGAPAHAIYALSAAQKSEAETWKLHASSTGLPRGFAVAPAEESVFAAR